MASADTFILPSGLSVEVPVHNELEWLWKKFTLPSGLPYFAWQLIPKAYAAEMTLKDQIILYIKQMAAKYKVDENILLEVAKCESQLNTTAVGDKGKAYGLFQFWLNTFNLFKKEAGFIDFEYKNWRHQTELAAWAFNKGYGWHWVCTKKLGLVK